MTKKGPASSADGKQSPKSPSRKPAKSREGAIGDALRSVYQQTVSEDVPSEFLDLLGKLD